MDIFIVFLILISALIHSYWNYLLKKTINGGGDSILLLWISSIISLILYFIVFLFSLFYFKITWYAIVLAAASGFFIAIYTFFMSQSYKYGDLSQVYPLSKVTPLFTLLIGIFLLKESISMLALIGIIFIIFGIYTIHLENFKIKSILKPISLFKTASLFALLTAISSAVYGLFTKIGVIGMNPFIFAYLSYLFLVIFYTPFLYFKSNKTILEFKKFKKNLIKIGFLDFFSYTIIVFALTSTQLSYVFALRQVSILFGVLLGIYILKEKYGRIRIISSIILLIGIILLSIG